MSYFQGNPNNQPQTPNHRSRQEENIDDADLSVYLDLNSSNSKESELPVPKRQTSQKKNTFHNFISKKKPVKKSTFGRHFSVGANGRELFKKKRSFTNQDLSNLISDMDKDDERNNGHYSILGVEEIEGASMSPIGSPKKERIPHKNDPVDITKSFNFGENSPIGVRTK